LNFVARTIEQAWGFKLGEGVDGGSLAISPSPGKKWENSCFGGV
jgi:hypothetical protein